MATKATTPKRAKAERRQAVRRCKESCWAVQIGGRPKCQPYLMIAGAGNFTPHLFNSRAEAEAGRLLVLDPSTAHVVKVSVEWRARRTPTRKASPNYEATKKPAPASDWRGECAIRRSIMHDGYYASVFCGGKTWYLCEGNVWRHDPANDASENTQMFPSESAARAALDKADPPPGVEPASKETAFDAKVWAEKMVDCYPATPSAIGVGSLDRTVGASLFLPDFKKEVIVATMKDWRHFIAAALQSAYDAGRAAGMAVSP